MCDSDLFFFVSVEFVVFLGMLVWFCFVGLIKYFGVLKKKKKILCISGKYGEVWYFIVCLELEVRG